MKTGLVGGSLGIGYCGRRKSGGPCDPFCQEGSFVPGGETCVHTLYKWSCHNKFPTQGAATTGPCTLT